MPLAYLNRSFPRTTLMALYAEARVGLVTPLRDGMNLVAKEYVAAQDPADPGVLVLSQFAGAARELTAALEHRRLDLLGLRVGYESQDEKLHAAVLAQLPRIGLGFSKASDTTNVHTTGGVISIDLPIFDRNQGNTATEKATRQSLYDEYMNRLFQARVDVAQATADLRSLNAQLAAAAKALSDLGHLLEVADVIEVLGPARVGRVPGNRHGDRDSFVQRGQQQALPSPAGHSSHGDAAEETFDTGAEGPAARNSG